MAEEYVDRGDVFEGSEDEVEELEDVIIDDDEEEEEDLEQEEEELEEQDEEEYEEEEEEVAPKKSPKIPKARLDEVIRQREEAKDRNYWLEQQLEKLIAAQERQNQTVQETKVVIPEYDFEGAEEKYISLVIEGEVAQATKLRKEITAKQQEQFLALINGVEANAANKAKSESSSYIEAERFKIAIESMEVKYPYLNFKDKAYNEEAVDTVNTLLAGYVAAGKSKTEALQLAITKVRPLYEKKVSKPSPADERKIAAGKKAAAASKQQPTKTKSSNSRTSDGGIPNIQKMGEKEFSKLTAKEKSILRGD